MFDTKYFVNEEKRTVVCKICNTFDSVAEDMAKRGLYPNDSEAFMTAICDDEFIGKARCSAEDVFDVEKGKRIAYKRAVLKYFNAKKKILERVRTNQLKHFNIFRNAADKIIESYDKTIARAVADCERIINGDI